MARAIRVLKVENFRIADAIEAKGGPGSLGNAGQSGVNATGGSNNDGTFAQPSPGGDGILATGGTTLVGLVTVVRVYEARVAPPTAVLVAPALRVRAVLPEELVSGLGGGTRDLRATGSSAPQTAPERRSSGQNTGGGDGVLGQSTGGVGLRGTSTAFVGIVGISSTGHGLYGSTNGGAGVFGGSWPRTSAPTALACW